MCKSRNVETPKRQNVKTSKLVFSRNAAGVRGAATKRRTPRVGAVFASADDQSRDRKGAVACAIVETSKSQNVKNIETPYYPTITRAR